MTIFPIYGRALFYLSFSVQCFSLNALGKILRSEVALAQFKCLKIIWLPLFWSTSIGPFAASPALQVTYIRGQGCGVAQWGHATALV